MYPYACVCVCLCVLAVTKTSKYTSHLKINSNPSPHTTPSQLQNTHHHHHHHHHYSAFETWALELPGCDGAVESLIPLFPPLPLLLHLVLGLLLAHVLLPPVFLGAELLGGLVGLSLVGGGSGLGSGRGLGCGRGGRAVQGFVYLVGLWRAWGDMDQTLRLHWDAVLIVVFLLDVMLGDVLQVEVLLDLVLSLGGVSGGGGYRAAGLGFLPVVGLRLVGLHVLAAMVVMFHPVR